MYLQVNFGALLAAIVLVLAQSEDVLAAPQAARRAPNGMVTMPIRSLHKARSDIHPHIYLQQHINRAHKRLARMTGAEAPSDLELRDRLQKRVDRVHEGYALGLHSHSKRYVITDKGKSGSEPSLIQANAAAADPFAHLKSIVGQLVGGKKHKANNASGAGAGAGATGNSNSTAEPPAPPAGGDNSTASGNSTSSTANGVDPADIAASQNGGVTKATGTLSNNSIGLDIEADDVGYLGQVQIGTPPRNFEILMDSGSADFWVGAENCQTESAQGQGAGAGQAGAGQAQGANAISRRARGQGGNNAAQQGAATGAGNAAGNTCGNHSFLGTQSSSTFKDSNQQFQVTYGTGNVAGDIVQDNVVLAGLPLNAHTFGVATQESVDFSADTTPFDGLMGLAQSTLSEQKTLTPVESLAKAGSIADAITSFKISRLADQKNDGEVTFGGLDATKFDPNTAVTFANVNQQGFWEGAMTPTVNGQSVGLDQGRTAILDTGTTLIVAPPDDAAAVHQAIQGSQSDGQGGFTVPCTMTESVALTFNNQSFAIDPRDIAFLPVDANNPTGDCTSGISSGQIGGATEWLVGDVFLKNAYFSTDVGKNAVTLAKLV